MFLYFKNFVAKKCFFDKDDYMLTIDDLPKFEEFVSDSQETTDLYHSKYSENDTEESIESI